MQLAQDGAQDTEAREDRGGYDGIAANSNVEGTCCTIFQLVSLLMRPVEKIRKLGIRGPKRTIASLIEAMLGVAVASKDDDPVTAVLQADGGVDDQPLGAAYA